MGKTIAVINVNLLYLSSFITKDNELYSNYHLGISGEARKPASSENDSKRHTADALLHGHYADKIRHAVLSLDGNGLISYGNCALHLKDVTIADRTSLLEENSYYDMVTVFYHLATKRLG